MPHSHLLLLQGVRAEKMYQVVARIRTDGKLCVEMREMTISNTIWYYKKKKTKIILCIMYKRGIKI